MDRPQAIQFVAVTLAPLEGEARRARAWEVGDQMDQACRALRALPPTSTSCLGVVQVQLRAARNLCESWIEWWDEIQDLPREAARPEPRLEGLLWPAAPRPGTLPPYAPLVHTTCDDLARHHDSLHEADRASFRQLLYTAHYEAHAAGEAIGWPALQCLSLELGELAKRLQ